MRKGMEIETPAIVDLLSSASTRAAKRTTPKTAAATSRFPIVVSSTTRDFLERQAEATGGSLAGLCGVILNEVVAQTTQRVKSDKARGSATSAEN